MVAFLGLLFGELAAPNGIFGKIDGPAIYQFQQTYTVVPVFWQITLAICGLIETVNIMKGWQPLEDSLKEPSGLAKLKPTYTPGTQSLITLFWHMPNVCIHRYSRIRPSRIRP